MSMGIPAQQRKSLVDRNIEPFPQEALGLLDNDAVRQR